MAPTRLHVVNTEGGVFTRRSATRYIAAVIVTETHASERAARNRLIGLQAAVLDAEKGLARVNVEGLTLSEAQVRFGAIAQAWEKARRLLIEGLDGYQRTYHHPTEEAITRALDERGLVDSRTSPLPRIAQLYYVLDAARGAVKEHRVPSPGEARVVSWHTTAALAERAAKALGYERSCGAHVDVRRALVEEG